MAPPFIDAGTVERLLDFPSLIAALRCTFLDPPPLPARLSLPIEATASSAEGVLLVMPALRPDGLIVVKLITVHPALSGRAGGALRSVVMALDAATGETLGIIDGHALTNRRTAAAPVLAATVLARPDSRRLCVLGGGGVAEALAQAYATAFDLVDVTVWTRRPEAARSLAARLTDRGVAATATEDLAAAVGQADIVASATLAAAPILFGWMVRPGTHVDLVGGFNAAMRESDDALIARARVVVDGPGALLSGDIAHPLANKVIDAGAILDLSQLLAAPPPRAADEVTLFKSAGLALEDLAAAELLFHRLPMPEGNPHP